MQSTDEFFPDLFNPFYFIRRGLYDEIKKCAWAMKGKMLDFGCGTKPYRSLFNVEEYIGLDYENEGHPHHNEQIDVFYDGKNIPFPDEHFDSVLSSEVFEHIFNLDEVLDEINRVLKPGGSLLITCPFVWNEHEIPHDFARYTRFALTAVLQKHGFEVVHQAKGGNFITALAQLNVLYWYNVMYHRVKNLFVLRWIYKIFFVFLPNVTGVLGNLFLPRQQSLYLNNIFLAKKK